jgi:hypothetical protein
VSARTHTHTHTLTHSPLTHTHTPPAHNNSSTLITAATKSCFQVPTQLFLVPTHTHIITLSLVLSQTHTTCSPASPSPYLRVCSQQLIHSHCSCSQHVITRLSQAHTTPSLASPQLQPACDHTYSHKLTQLLRSHHHSSESALVARGSESTRIKRNPEVVLNSSIADVIGELKMHQLACQSYEAVDWFNRRVDPVLYPLYVGPRLSRRILQTC